MSKSQDSRKDSKLQGVIFPSGQGREQVHLTCSLIAVQVYSLHMHDHYYSAALRSGVPIQ